MAENWLYPKISANTPSKPLQNQAKNAKPTMVNSSFAQALEQATAKSVVMSAHASQRLQMRGVPVTTQTMSNLNKAAEQLSAKNAKESLVIMGGVGYVLNVPNRTVVTAMRLGEQETNVITNIDSALVMPNS